MDILTRLLPGDPRGTRALPFDGADWERDVKEKSLKKIKSFAQRDLEPDEFHVRGMLLCNTRPDYYYSEFTPGAIREIVEMLPGAPVMRGHDYYGLPVGRFFDAEVVQLEEPGIPRAHQTWAKGLYYVPADAEGNALVKRIDMGVQPEVSIGWRCVGADCTECGEPIWACRHLPGDIYDKGVARYAFSGITSVLEGSMVFRGGQKDTQTFIPGGDGDPTVSATAAREREAIETGQVTWSDIRAFKRLRRESGGERALWFGMPGERDNVQALLCSREFFGTPARAARWVRDYDFRADRKRVTDDEYSYEQFPMTLAEPDSARSLKLDEGVTARIVTRKPREKEGRSANDDALRTLFGCTR